MNNAAAIGLSDILVRLTLNIPNSDGVSINAEYYDDS